jgi:hypothetical protein
MWEHRPFWIVLPHRLERKKGWWLCTWTDWHLNDGAAGAVGEKSPQEKPSHEKLKPSAALGRRKGGTAYRLFGTNSFWGGGGNGTWRPIAREQVINTFPGIRKLKMFPQRLILGNQHVAMGSTGVSVDTSDQQTFSWILIRYVRCRSDQNTERPEWSQSERSKS